MMDSQLLLWLWKQGIEILVCFFMLTCPSTTPTPHEFLSTEDWAIAIMVMTAMALVISIMWSISTSSACRN